MMEINTISMIENIEMEFERITAKFYYHTHKHTHALTAEFHKWSFYIKMKYKIFTLNFNENLFVLMLMESLNVIEIKSGN